MADNQIGIMFTQSGVPVRGASDYQKVYDSRWKFIEIEVDTEIKVELPSVAGSSVVNVERTNIYRHGIGFVPMFECNLQDQSYPIVGRASVRADKDYIYIKRKIYSDGAQAQSLNIKLRVYNLDVLHDYTAPKQPPEGLSSAESNIGIKFVDGTEPVDPSNNAPTGFSVDTTKKILSIHKHGLAKINDYIFRLSSVTAIDVNTNTLTIAPYPYATGVSKDFSWISEAGRAVRIDPGRAGTNYPYPAPLTQTSNVSYIIPIDSTHVQLASSYERAINRIPLDITSTGDLPGMMVGVDNPSVVEDSIEHNVGYPPTFVIAEVDSDSITSYYADPLTLSVGPMLESVLAMVSADTRYLKFRGIQAVYGRWLAYIILKDPAELAQ